MAGNVTFEYKVSAEEGYDGLYFIVNDLIIMFDSNSDWRTYTYNLSAGYHIIQWYSNTPTSPIFFFFFLLMMDLDLI
jgi:hypothetical protein